MRAYLDEIEEEDDGHWDDWDIAAEPGGVSSPSDGSEPALNFSLAREIRSLRTLLDRIEAGIAAEAEPERLVLPLTRLVESIARTLRIHSGITGGPDDELQDAVNRVFKDLGLDA